MGKTSNEHVTIIPCKYFSKGAVNIRFSPDVGNNPNNSYSTYKRIHCGKSRFSSRGEDPWNNIRSSTLVQQSNSIVIWTDIPLFTSPFFRDSYWYPFWNSSCSKNCVLVVKKNTWFCSIQCYTQNETIPPKKWKKVANYLFEFLRSPPRAVTHAVTHLSCDGAGLSDRLFGQNKPFFFFTYVCFVGNVAVSIRLASVWLISAVITLTELELSLNLVTNPISCWQGKLGK